MPKGIARRRFSFSRQRAYAPGLPDQIRFLLRSSDGMKNVTVMLLAVAPLTYTPALSGGQVQAQAQVTVSPGDLYKSADSCLFLVHAEVKST